MSDPNPDHYPPPSGMPTPAPMPMPPGFAETGELPAPPGFPPPPAGPSPYPPPKSPPPAAGCPPPRWTPPRGPNPWFPVPGRRFADVLLAARPDLADALYGRCYAPDPAELRAVLDGPAADEAVLNGPERTVAHALRTGLGRSPDAWTAAATLLGCHAHYPGPLSRLIADARAGEPRVLPESARRGAWFHTSTARHGAVGRLLDHAPDDIAGPAVARLDGGQQQYLARDPAPSRVARLLARHGLPYVRDILAAPKHPRDCAPWENPDEMQRIVAAAAEPPAPAGAVPPLRPTVRPPHGRWHRDGDPAASLAALAERHGIDRAAGPGTYLATARRMAADPWFGVDWTRARKESHRLPPDRARILLDHPDCPRDLRERLGERLDERGRGAPDEHPLAALDSARRGTPGERAGFSADFSGLGDLRALDAALWASLPEPAAGWAPPVGFAELLTAAPADCAIRALCGGAMLARIRPRADAALGALLRARLGDAPAAHLALHRLADRGPVPLPALGSRPGTFGILLDRAAAATVSP